MSKQALAAERRRMWVFGQSWDFQAVTSTVALAAANYRCPGGAMVRKPKRAIVLHATLGNSSAAGVLNYWNTQNVAPPVPSGTGAQWLMERSSTAQQARPAPVGPAPDNTDVGLVDAVRFIDDEAIVFHGNSANDFSIGIEIANATDLWFNTNVANEPSLAGGHLLAACPTQ